MLSRRQSPEERSSLLSRFVAAAVQVAVLGLCMLPVVLWTGAAEAQTSQPLTVNFPSADGKTDLVGFLFAPAGRPKTAPAVVLMHGRHGVYSPLARGDYSSLMLDKSLRTWAQLWAGQGYWALVVDSFGPRGHPAGLPPGAPDAVAERALDAYGALRYLRASPRVKADRIAVQGWSDGGSAALASMNRDELGGPTVDRNHGFRAAIALDPSCNPDTLATTDYTPYAPIRVFLGAHDRDIVVAACEKLAAATRLTGADMTVTVFESSARDFADRGWQHPATTFLAPILGH